jgi:hypothetical protein
MPDALTFTQLNYKIDNTIVKMLFWDHANYASGENKYQLFWQRKKNSEKQILIISYK